ncbi:anaphase-promoting complex component Cut20/Apc4 [Cordyceps fumosorosea ARSEF 2679]|uniref:Anaphase-promoting complex subunit 4 n=1 Tax=Cordyceps fumosorosea (strain ARSEF 2679) TaxID=1081104 RepID=A0A167RP54_CORFA|nr:anaphase-promoting complex component Cut20/Apc4 [Cordyceps fumosorosea ARSEF 2679]OAA58788.1 anaphase-promoting complex component Cut20/Apc4 [Cordyceps fumosorosea ARSEF 2679]
MAGDASLRLLSEAEFEFKAPTGFPVSCPTLDLSATWDGSDKNLFIYRPPNQAVSKIHQLGPLGSKAPDALAVTWKPDGQFLAVGWSDGAVRIMGLENNKAVHQMHICNDDAAKITHIGWTTSLINKKPGKNAPKSGEKLLDELILDNGSGALDLPQELTFLEVDTALPKISPLPTASAGAGDDATVFTLRTGIEFLFQTPKRSAYDQVNIMVVGTSDGQLHLSIYDSFVIGVFTAPSLGALIAPRLVLHAACPTMSTQALLMADDTNNPSEIHLVPVDLPFVSSSPINLSLLASKLTTLQTLLRYLKQTQLHMLTEWKNARELPKRFLQSVQGDLSEMQSGPRTIVAALYHTAVTGHAYEPLREWLVDSVAERGHKRWDKAVTAGLEGLRNLVHENLLPGLERCSVILSRLRGFAQFYDTRDDLGFTATQVGRVLDVVGCLSLVGHRILLHVMDELEHFAAFSGWLRFQIDRLASTGADELTEREATLDTSRVLTYIERYLTGGPLDAFFAAVPREDYEADWAHAEDGLSLLEVLDRQLKKAEAGQPAMKALPQVDFLMNYASTWTGRIFKDVADAKKRSVRFGVPMRLKIGAPITKMDVKMAEAAAGAGGGTVYTALASKETANKVYVFRAELSVVNGISLNRSLSSRCIDLGDSSLIDLGFIDATTLVLLCTSTDPSKPAMFTVPVESDATLYEPYVEDAAPDSIRGMPLAATGGTECRLPEECAMRPVRMEVHGEHDVQGQIAARICLLASNRTTWRTFTLLDDNDTAA